MAGTSNNSKLQSRLWFDPLARSLVKQTNRVIEGIGDATQGIENTTTEIQKNTAAWFHKYEPYLEDVQKQISNVSTGIDDITNSIDRALGRALSTIQKGLSGWSSHTGAIAALNGIAKDPLNANNVGNNVKSLLNSVSPGFGDTIDNNIQSLNLDKAIKAPEMLFSSIERLARSADNILAIPLSYISTIYFGAIEIVKKIGKALNKLIDSFFTFLFEFANTIIPLKDVLGLLQSVGQLAGQIQGIATIFGGANIVAGFALQINTLTTQINSAISNPFDTIIGQLPVDISNNVSQVIYALNNPQSIINQYLPPELSQMFAKVSQITGYGFNGNMGYGFESILKASQEGLITGILQNFAAQYSILAPLLAGQAIKSQNQTGSTPTLANGYNTGLNNRNFNSKPQWVVS